jgi:hypothetical protein
MLRITEGSNVVGPEPFNCSQDGFRNTIPPGQSLTFPEAWSQRGLNGIQVPAGQYTIQVWYNVGVIGDISLAPDQIPTKMAANPVQVIVSP